jgi:hypothetical protein
MNRLTWASGLVLATALVGAPAVASAQVDQLIGVQVGGLFPRAEGSRVAGDVLNENLVDFSFDPAGPGDTVGRGIEAFRSGQFGGEYLLGFGDWVEAGVSINFYQKEINSQYRDFTNPDDSEITQRFRLRMVPVTASARWFPTGRTTPVQAYVGAGVNFYRWNYREQGNFIDFTNPNANPLPIINGTFEDDGTAVGPVVLGGVRFPFAHNHFLIGGEFRYQWGTADLDPSLSFTGNKLDLGGASAAATFHVRF